MSKRAEKFIEDRMNPSWYTSTGEFASETATLLSKHVLAERLEAFHKECQPTDAEYHKIVDRAIKFNQDKTGNYREASIGMTVIELVKNFVREEPEISGCSIKDMYGLGMSIADIHSSHPRRGNFIWSDESKSKVIWVDDPEGRLLLQKDASVINIDQEKEKLCHCEGSAEFSEEQIGVFRRLHSVLGMPLPDFQRTVPKKSRYIVIITYNDRFVKDKQTNGVTRTIARDVYSTNEAEAMDMGKNIFFASMGVQTNTIKREITSCSAIKL